MALRPVSVSELNNYIKNLIQGDPMISNLILAGEISYWKPNTRTGAVFFTIKDERSQIDCVMWSDAAARITVPYEIGMMVELHGRVDYWNNRGQVRFNAAYIRPAGEGELNARYERLKAKLIEEGLFSQDRKKPLPVFPKNVVVITSPEGSAAWDIKKTIVEKNEYVNIFVYPVKVQGQGAAGEIAAAIDAVNSSPRSTDVMIVARGGGSPEERWAFNEEIVVRSIAASRIPVVTGIGHEDNESLSDLAADFYAKTPTAAADAAVPDTHRIREELMVRYEYTERNFARYMNRLYEKTDALDPSRMISRLKGRVSNGENHLQLLRDRMNSSMKLKLSDTGNRVRLMKNRLEDLSPKNIMSRGYSAVTDEEGRLLGDVDRIKTGDTVNVTMINGELRTRVTEINKNQ